MKISKEEFYKSLWRCRDFEIQNLWQRSIFLTAFMLLSYTGYGAVLLKMVELATTPYSLPVKGSLDGLVQSIEFKSVSENVDCLFFLNIVALAICFLGMLFSILWILMGKASKGWYEVYEKAICAFERNPKYTKFHDLGGFNYVEMSNFEKVKLNDCILSLKAGAYSPSKINIAIGQISFFSWIVLFLLHCTLIHFDVNFSNFREGLISAFLFLFLGIGCAVVVVYAMCNGCSTLQSSALKSNGEYTE